MEALTVVLLAASGTTPLAVAHVGEIAVALRGTSPEQRPAILMALRPRRQSRRDLLRSSKPQLKPTKKTKKRSKRSKSKK